MLDSIFSRLFWRGEAVVAGSMEIFEAAGVVLELVALPWHNGLLFGHTLGSIRKKKSATDLSYVYKAYTVLSSTFVLPNIEFLSKKEVVVQVSDCPVHRVTVSHLHHCCSRLAFHELNLIDETRLKI